MGQAIRAPKGPYKHHAEEICRGVVGGYRNSARDKKLGETAPRLKCWPRHAGLNNSAPLRGAETSGSSRGTKKPPRHAGLTTWAPPRGAKKLRPRCAERKNLTLQWGGSNIRRRCMAPQTPALSRGVKKFGIALRSQKLRTCRRGLRKSAPLSGAKNLGSTTLD